jgi:hypothetical protein
MKEKQVWAWFPYTRRHGLTVVGKRCGRRTSARNYIHMKVSAGALLVEMVREAREAWALII